LNESEPQLALGGFSCPKYLDELAKKEWHRVVKDLRESGVLAKVDRSMLETYCIAYSMARQAEEDVKDNGLTVFGAKGGVIKNPSISTAVAYRTLMTKVMAELGMSASSRSRLKVNPPNNKKTLAEVLFDGVEVEGEND
jgi:P27 family predicted phage terminase small subunit